MPRNFNAATSSAIFTLTSIAVSVEYVQWAAEIALFFIIIGLRLHSNIGPKPWYFMAVIFNLISACIGCVYLNRFSQSSSNDYKTSDISEGQNIGALVDSAEKFYIASTFFGFLSAIVLIFVLSNGETRDDRLERTLPV